MRAKSQITSDSPQQSESLVIRPDAASGFELREHVFIANILLALPSVMENFPNHLVFAAESVWKARIIRAQVVWTAIAIRPIQAYGAVSEKKTNKISIYQVRNSSDGGRLSRCST